MGEGEMEGRLTVCDCFSLQVLILNPAFLKYIQDNWTRHHGKYPSTGFIALMFAIHTCRQVHKLSVLQNDSVPICINMLFRQDCILYLYLFLGLCPHIFLLTVVNTVWWEKQPFLPSLGKQPFLLHWVFINKMKIQALTTNCADYKLTV